jgi:hypothetical protein
MHTAPSIQAGISNIKVRTILLASEKRKTYEVRSVTVSTSKYVR